MKNDKSWRAMLIKDNEGDWGICVAVWRGMKKGTPGVPGKITCSNQLFNSLYQNYKVSSQVSHVTFSNNFFQENPVQKGSQE